MEKATESVETTSNPGRYLAGWAGSTVIAGTLSSEIIKRMNVTDFNQAALTTALIAVPVYYLSLWAFEGKGKSLKENFLKRSLGALVLAGALGTLTGVSMKNGQDYKNSFNALPEISPATLVISKPQTLAEKNCANIRSGHAVAVEHDGRQYKLTCP